MKLHLALRILCLHLQVDLHHFLLLHYKAQQWHCHLIVQHLQILHGLGFKIQNVHSALFRVDNRTHALKNGI